MIHPHTELRRVDEHVGYGVFATEPIPQGTIVWVLDDLDQKMSDARAAALGATYAPILDRYTYRNSRGERILCWDLARYINHSCEATCLSPGLAFEIAIRDILPGEQLTDDYGSLNLEEAFECRCGSRHCRGTIRPGDFELFSDAWDARVRPAFARIPHAPQPLWHMVKQTVRIDAGLAHPDRIPSILRHRWKPAIPVVGRNGAPRRRREARTGREG